MPEIISDDTGSFPLPEGVEREEIQRIAFEIVTGEASPPQQRDSIKLLGI